MHTNKINDIINNKINNMILRQGGPLWLSFPLEDSAAMIPWILGN